MFIEKPSVVAIDLDNTLIYFENGKDDLFNIFVRQGVDLSVVRACYLEVRKDFNLDNFYNLVCVTISQKLNYVVIEKEFNNWVRAQLKTYVDAQLFLNLCNDENIPIVLVTFGNRNYQAKKLMLVGDHLIDFDRIIIVEDDLAKHIYLADLALEFGGTLLFLDDKPAELELCKGRSNIIPIRVCRDDSPYAEEVYEGFAIDGLEEITFQ